MNTNQPNQNQPAIVSAEEREQIFAAYEAASLRHCEAQDDLAEASDAHGRAIAALIRAKLELDSAESRKRRIIMDSIRANRLDAASDAYLKLAEEDGCRVSTDPMTGEQRLVQP